MTKQKAVPEVRFKGFSGEWEEKSLGIIADIVRGASPRPIKDPKWFDDSSEIGWLRIADVTAQGGRITYLDQRISKLGQEKTRVLNESHLLLSIAATIGKPVINYVKTGVHDGFLIFQNIKFEREFMFQWLDNFRPNWKRYGQPGSQVNLNSDLVKNHKIFMPEEDEQIRIGELFRNLDNRITLEQRKHKKLQNIKKAMLEKMFPKPDATVPEVRFQGFGGEWEEKRLGEVADIIGGGTPSTSNPSYWSGDIDWYSPTEIGKDVYADRSVKKITNLGLEKSAAKLLPANKTVLFTSRAGIGDMAILRNVAATNQGFQSLVLKGKIDTYFIYSMGILIKAYAEKNASGSTFLEIYGKVLANMPVLLPCETEQTRIGDFFRNLDSLITLQQRKCEKLDNIKKAMLGKMFV